jgi:hypothetical protein
LLYSEWSKMPTALPEERFLCLDMLRVSWINASGRASADCTILMEIWDSGAILQSETAIPEQAILTISAPGGPVQAEVTSCMQDPYGFLIRVTVDPSQNWFPKSYQPVHLMANSSR